jgi:uroporphyrinogen III methyltransferase/synthase
MIDRAAAGATVVRLKGGDPFIFGRAAEELEALVAAEIPFELVPGVSSLSAVPAYAGILLTQRRVASTVAVASGHAAAEDPGDPPDWGALAGAQTAVLFMALKTAAECAARLIEGGRDPSTPAAAIYWGTTASQRVVTAPLGELGDAVADAGLRPPVLIVVGEVAAEARRFPWRSRLPLAGARVLVPRPRRRAGELAAVLTRLGAEALCAPFTRIVESTGAVRDAALAAISGAGDRDWVLFSSATAVERALAALIESGGDVRQLAGVKIGCVGESTAAALARLGIRADLIPGRRSSAGLADAMLAAGGGPQRVLICRAEHGRADADRALFEAGWDVAAAELYRSAPGDPDDPAIARALRRARAGELDVAAFFAPSQVRAYSALAAGAPRPRLIAAIGATTAAAIDTAGLGPIDVVASRPAPETFAAEIAAVFARGCP